jgi:large subunit ribosomal protein L32e
MADEEPKPVKRAKKAMPEVPPEPETKVPLPTPPEIRGALKAQLVEWSKAFGLDEEGKVDQLRSRLLKYVEMASAEARTSPVAEAKVEEAEVEAPAPKEPEKKKPTKRAAKKAEEKAKEKEAAEKEEAEEYEPKLKPKLDDRTRRLMALRSARSAARPRFRRQEWFRYKKFGDEWRKPHGGQSKLRRHFGYRWNIPSIGYRGPREVRGLHPSGFQEVLIHNVRQLEGLDPARQAVRVAHGVGSRKREEIEKTCDDKGLRLLNRTVTR